MEEQKAGHVAVSPVVPVTDDDLRLQNLVAGWEGVSRGEPLSALHQECLQTVGQGKRSLLPAQLVLVTDLDAATLETALAQRPLSSYQAGSIFVYLQLVVLMPFLFASSIAFKSRSCLGSRHLFLGTS